MLKWVLGMSQSYLIVMGCLMYIKVKYFNTVFSIWNVNYITSDKPVLIVQNIVSILPCELVSVA